MMPDMQRINIIEITLGGTQVIYRVEEVGFPGSVRAEQTNEWVYDNLRMLLPVLEIEQ